MAAGKVVIYLGRRNLYLSNTPVHEALAIYMEALQEKITAVREKIPVIEALGRITAAAVYAKYCSPLYNAAAMDGIMVLSAHTSGASEATPVDLELGKDYQIVDTGDPVSPQYDAVIMAEDLIELENGKLRILASVAPWEHIRPIGEDIVAGEMILPSNHLIRSIDIGVLLSAGITELEVIQKPRVAIFPTGTEMIEPGQIPKIGDIIESNSRMFENMVYEKGGIAVRFPAIEDHYDRIKEKITAAVQEYDAVIINAGSSAGTEDYTVHVLRELGTVLVHGVAIKPGKPVILALVGNTPVIGLPGYPVSAYIGFQNFVVPVLDLFLERKMRMREPGIEAIISKRMVSSLKHKEYIHVKVGSVGDKIVASPLARGAGAAMSLVRADGFCIIEQNSEGVEAGETVRVELYRSAEEIKNTLVIIGSHDLILDVMADMMPHQYKDLYISSTHVGSMGGLMALQRGETHMAPIHLLDEKTGEYNLSYIRQMFDDQVALIRGVGRVQGFMVKKGNPLAVHTMEDLRGKRYVNRQRGAGTRILFDFMLKKANIDRDEINGYANEMTTHMAVAALVQSESADVGLGIQSAAVAMDLDFIPVGLEEYDFAIRKEYLELPSVKAFIHILQSEAFKEKLVSLGGYTGDHLGEIIYL